MVEPVNFFKGTLLAFWYGIDHFLGTFYLKKNSDNVIIFSRSYHDFLYQRSFRKVPKKLNKIFLLIGPEPDLIIVPQRPEAEIFDAKPELSKEEIVKQYNLIKENFLNKENLKIIDASHGLSKTIGLIYKYYEE